MTAEPAATVMMPPGRSRGAALPWWAKIAVKLILARLPLPYAWWRRLGIFRHGTLRDDVERRGIDFLGHLARYRERCGESPRRIVELGPGDSVAAALWARASGAEGVWLIDVGRFAVEEPAHYRAVVECIARHGLAPPALPAPGGIAAVLAATGAVYRTDGLAGFAALADGSVDFIFSQAVLEHLPLAQFDHFLAESFRALRPGGLCSHAIDLQDHLGGALNHLRFSRPFWECRAIARGGFYTNRLRAAEICRRATAAGFEVRPVQFIRWPAVPTPRAALDPEFQAYSDDELTIAVVTLVLRKPEAG